MGEPGGLLSMRLHRVGHDRSDLAAAGILNSCVFSFFRRRQWHPTPVLSDAYVENIKKSQMCCGLEMFIFCSIYVNLLYVFVSIFVKLSGVSN